MWHKVFLVICWKTCLKCLWGNVLRCTKKVGPHTHTHTHTHAHTAILYTFNTLTHNKEAITVQAVTSCIFKKYYSTFLCMSCFLYFCTFVQSLNKFKSWLKKYSFSYTYEQSGPQIDSILLTVQSELIKRMLDTLRPMSLPSDKKQ